MKAGRRAWLRRLRRVILWTVGLCLLVSVGSVALLRFVHPFTSAFIAGSYLSAWQAGDFHYRADYRWTDYSDISRHAKLAVIASEDQKFAFHPGFDFDAIDRAVKERESGKRKRGASTITQQVAKNLFLWSGPSFVRKGIEAYLTLLIEALWPKHRILEIYLNVAEFAPGVYGVGAAAPRLFHTTPARLTRGQAALLAAVLPAPAHFHADQPSSYVLRRQAWIITQMNALGGEAYIRDVDGTR